MISLEMVGFTGSNQNYPASRLPWPVRSKQVDNGLDLPAGFKERASGTATGQLRDHNLAWIRRLIVFLMMGDLHGFRKFLYARYLVCDK